MKRIKLSNDRLKNLQIVKMTFMTSVWDFILQKFDKAMTKR